MSRDDAHLVDVLRAAQSIQRFVAGVTRTQFIANEEKYEAVCRKFEIMGEAARHLAPVTLAALPDVPWRKIVGMRNILIHDYGQVDLDIVWDTAHHHLPGLIVRINSHLEGSTPPEE
jgi:uncharacterized protein with HEPN domain